VNHSGIQSRPLLLALLFLAACSKTPGSDNAAHPAGEPVGNACDRKLLSVDDVAGIVGPPITGTSPLRGDPQTCYFDTATSESEGGPRIMVSLRPGLGKVTVDSYKAGKMNVPVAPLQGVGESAVWVEEAHEVDAQKNDLLCVAEAGGSALAALDLQKKLGALCNRIFARIGA
jgi:hypothetical protein